MYAQEHYFYRRPDTSNVHWFTPQELEAARVARCLDPIRGREIAPLVRPASATTSVQNILADAKSLMADAMRKGLAVVHKEMPMSHIPVKGLRKFTAAHRRKMSIAARLQHQQSTK